MYKVFSLIKRPDDMSFEDFQTWVTEEHPKLAKQIPGMVKYVVNVVTSDNPDNVYDAINELYFENEESFKAGFGSEQGAAAGKDAAGHAGIRHRLVLSENQLI